MKLRYNELDLNDENDKKIMDRIISFDTTKECFGDYDFYDVANEYTNLAVYIKNKLIGYVGFSISETNNYIITICIREEYRSQGLGDTILKQTIDSLFNVYNANSITAEAIKTNYKCNKMIQKNNFIKETEDYFLKNGEYVNTNIYKYTRKRFFEYK